MLHASTQQLIRKLHELTEAGGLAWKEGERETSRLETEGYIVEVEATPPGIRLLRGDGRELEKATADDLAAVAWPGGDGTYATRVAEMAARAHRFARGAEHAIATILSSLSAPAKKPAPQPLATGPTVVAPTPAAPVPVQAVAPPAPQPKTQPPAEPPKPTPAPVIPPVAAAPVSQPAPPLAATAPSSATPSPAKPTPEPGPAPKAPEPASPPKKPDMLSQGISARSVQGVEQSSASDLQRIAPGAAQPTPQPAPVPTPRPQQPPTTGPGVYKPWN